MAEQHPDRNLRGGTEGGEPGRSIDVELRDEGTPGTTAPGGGVRVEAPAHAEPRTPLADRPVESTRLAGGKTSEDVLGYLGGLDFPAKKDAIVRAVRRNGAPEDVLGALMLLDATEYHSPEQLLADYPRLSEAGAITSGKAF